MTEQPSPAELQTKKNALLRLFDRMVPLIDGVSYSVRFAALLGLALVTWIFVWMFYLNNFALPVALMVCGASVLPILVLLYLWWSLEELKQLPANVADMMQGAKTEVQQKVSNIRSGTRSKMGLLTSARSVLKIGSMVGEARELLGSYVRVGSLMSPLLLLLGFLSLLYIVPLFLTSMLLALLALWP